MGFNYFAYYDASVQHHENFFDFLNSGNYKYLSLFKDTIYNFAVFFIVLIIITVLKKRWIKNGVVS